MKKDKLYLIKEKSCLLYVIDEKDGIITFKATKFLRGVFTNIFLYHVNKRFIEIFEPIKVDDGNYQELLEVASTGLFTCSRKLFVQFYPVL